MQPEFIKLQNKRFRVADISHYSCTASSRYVGNPPIITIYKQRFKDGYEVKYWTLDGNQKADKETYKKDKDILDELLLGRTEGEDNLLP